jgi:two-component system NtrC family sensor kinase
MDQNPVQRRDANALYAIVDAINSSLSEQETLEAILERTVTELGYCAATLRLLDDEQQTLVLRAAYGLSEAYLTKGAVAVAQSGIDQHVLAGERVAVPDVAHDPLFHYQEDAAREGLISALAVPIDLRDRIIGVLRVYTAEPHTFGPDEQTFLAAVANLSGAALQRTHLFRAFQTITSQVNSSLDLSAVLATLLLHAVRELNVKASSIRLLGPAQRTLHLAAAYGLSQAYLQKGEVLVEQSPIDRQVLAEGPLQMRDVTEDPGFQYVAEARQEGLRSVLVVPLRSHGTNVGVMRFYSGQVRHFSSEEVTFAATVADMGGIAIENARLHEALKARLEALKEDASGWYRFLALS